MPTQAEMVASFQATNPHLSHADATMKAQNHLQVYHAQLSGTIAAQASRRPVVASGAGGVPRAAGTGGTGVLIGANGPIGPGAAAHQAQQQQQQSRQGTPVGVVMGQSPRMGQQVAVGSPRMPQQGVPVGMGVGVGLGVQMPQQQQQQQQQQ
jgi:hypothetical protein